MRGNEDKSLFMDSIEKNGWGRYEGSGLASRNNFNKLWSVGTGHDCLASSPGVIRAGVSGLECGSSIKEVTGRMGSGLAGAHSGSKLFTLSWN